MGLICTRDRLLRCLFGFLPEQLDVRKLNFAMYAGSCNEVCVPRLYYHTHYTGTMCTCMKVLAQSTGSVAVHIGVIWTCCKYSTNIKQTECGSLRLYSCCKLVYMYQHYTTGLVCARKNIVCSCHVQTLYQCTLPCQKASKQSISFQM